ncbi:DUF6939 family protein [Spirillospora sp. CA-142024]|uniref:DUF6939 family protein n=1 Tax=Spirillospora sp. CA-142024 TaxID=3240036 RepID=UPI003D90B04B
MPIHLASRRRTVASLAAEFPGAQIIDTTSKAMKPWVRLSPFYPHGGIPVPFCDDVTAQSVEGIWQALKVFDNADVDPAKLQVTTMRGLKRTVPRYGPVRGHRTGLDGARLLDYATARRLIYLPSYRWVLDNRVTDLLERLGQLTDRAEVVLLDYTTNGDITDLTKPLSHAALIRQYIKASQNDRRSESSPAG